MTGWLRGRPSPVVGAHLRVRPATSGRAGADTQVRPYNRGRTVGARFRQPVKWDTPLFEKLPEKALKALLVLLQVPFPKTHSLPELVRLLEQAGERPPEEVRRAVGLTKYAVDARYPGFGDDVDAEEWHMAVVQAGQVVDWVQRRLGEVGVAPCTPSNPARSNV